MGSPVSPVVANIYMFEELALRTATHPPQIWRCYVDDTFCVITKTEVEGFLSHFNSLRPTITFTAKKLMASYRSWIHSSTTRTMDPLTSASTESPPTQTDT